MLVHTPLQGSFFSMDMCLGVMLAFEAFRVCVSVRVCVCFEGGFNREMVVNIHRDSGGLPVKLKTQQTKKVQQS